MPSGYSSSSPEYERKHKKHHRSRSNSGERREHRHKRKKDRHRDGKEGHRHRREHRSREDSVDRLARRAIKREPEDDGYERRPIKQEREDPGYERHTRDGVRRREEEHQQRRERQRNDNKRRENRQRQQGNPFSNDQAEGTFGQSQDAGASAESKPKDKPDFGLSGKLAEDTNTFRGVVVKYNEPPEARKPKRKWRLYPFKNDEPLPILHIHRQSAYLLGRDRRVADIPIDHPSCSKQHAALQFRLIDYERDDGTIGRRVKPYVIDLNSANGTYVNNQRIESQRYLELFEKDVIKFGFSSREYVILHDNVDVSQVDEGGSD